jgi:DNA-binding MarR family transcriptional regulator
VSNLVEIDSAPTRLKSMPSWLINQASLPAQRLVNDALGAVGARRYDYSVLSALDEFGPASQADLGRRGGIDRSDMVALVNELGANGFVARTTDPSDRRRNVVTITAAGRRHLRRLDRLLAHTQDALLAPLSGREREQLMQMLSRVIEHHADR